MLKIALFSGKIYTAGTNFTRPPVVTVATNLNSDYGQTDKQNFLPNTRPLLWKGSSKNIVYLCLAYLGKVIVGS